MGVAEVSLFLRTFLRHPGKVGAVAPSSRALARAMAAGLNLSAEHSVVEFGPGTGPFTAELRNLAARPAGYLGIEREAAFVELLRRQYPDMPIAHGSAEDADRLVAEAGLRPVKAVICGLPFASLPPSVQDRIIAALDRLMKPGCEFRTFQYVHAWPLPTAVRYRRRMNALFGPLRSRRVVLANLPPALVLTWAR